MVVAMMLFYGAPDIHRGKQREDKGLNKGYHDLDEVHKQSKQRDHWRNHKALKDEDQAKQTQ